MLLILRFFTKNGPFFTWLVLAVFSIVLLCQTNPYHRSVWFGSANVVSGGVCSAVDGVTGYFNLRTTNMELMERMAQLEEENLALRAELQQWLDNDSTSDLRKELPYSFIVAHVVNNTITQSENYLVLNRGEADSVKVGMAVANQRGVVGLVSKVSKHYAQVISVLNPKLQLSVCLQHEQSAGTLIWDGESPMYARLEDLPRNVVYAVGDTVVTSGYGVSFPRGVPVGRISELISSSNNNNFLSFRVELFTHFDRVNDVYIIQNNQPCPF